MTTEAAFQKQVPPEGTGMIPASSRWIPTKDGDPRALGLFKRHYSCPPGPRKVRLFVAPGEKMVLLTPLCDALFVWLKNRIERYDHQDGVICTVFRNEGPMLSSDLITEAMHCAQQRWPGERLFTYVSPRHVTSPNPGYCFKRAGWRFSGVSPKGLHILDWSPITATNHEGEAPP